MVETTKKKWYVLHTYSGYEDKVKSDLLSRAQSMGMQDYIFRVMVPEQEKVEKVRGKKQDVEEKIFPGYVLVEMVMTDGIHLMLPALLVLTAVVLNQPHFSTKRLIDFYVNRVNQLSGRPLALKLVNKLPLLMVPLMVL